MKTTFLGKTANVLASASMLLATLAPLVVPSVALAAGNYTIPTSTSSVIGQTLNISGTSAANPQTGANSGQLMAVDWDLDQNASTTSWIEYPDAGGLTSFLPVFFGGNNNNAEGFNASWSGSHDYSSLGGGTYHVKVIVYHTQPSGQDGSDFATVSFTIVIPPTTAGLSVKKVLINTGGGTAATSSFSFQINGGTATPFEADGENVFTLAAGPYSVVEAPAAHYSIGYSNCSGTIVAGAATTTCTITNTFFNNPPVANNSSVTTNEDTATSSSVSATDADSDSLTYSFGSPLHGVLSLLNFLTGAFTYTPDANYNGADSFTFSAADLYSSSANGTVSITVNPVNDNPDALDDSATVAEDSVDNVINVLANDSILPDTGETLSITGVSSPANGTAVIDGTTVKYTPTANYSGSDSFTYTISDGNGGTDTATVNVTVGGTNDAPVAVADSYSTAEDTTLNIIAAAGVLTNDTDADSDPLTAVLDTDVSNGTLTLNADGSFDYTPDADFNGTDSFTYHAIDTSSAVSSTVTVTITVTPVNDAPVAVDQSISTAQNVPLPGTLGASDVDGDTLTYATTTDPANGILSFFNPATGAFTYTPNNNYTGSDTFDFKANDGSLDSNTATVDITFVPEPLDVTPPASVFDDGRDHQIIDTELVQLSLSGTSTDAVGPQEDPRSGVASASMSLYRLADAQTMDGEGFFDSGFPGLTCSNLEQVPIEIIALSLTSVEPLTVRWDPVHQSENPLTSLERGVYCAVVNATDNAGNIEHTTIAGPFAYTFTPPPPPPPPVSAPQCSDGIDNDGDGRVDYPSDNSCSDSGDTTEGNDGGGWFGGGAGQVLGASVSVGQASVSTGQVLGVSCGLYMDQHLRKGSAKNKPDQVTKLQQFLNKGGFGKFAPTGTFGPLTEAAAKAFQSKYADEILKPWSLSGPTGLVYLTTIRQLNLLECPELMLPLPALVPWNQNPNAQ